MFYLSKDFDQDISSWKTSKISDFGYMFDGADSFDKDISSWETSKATSMKFMFASANYFNQDIDSWDTSKVQEMNNMFAFALRFNQNIDSWDTSNVQTFRSMFRSAVSFNQCLSSWQPTQNCVDVSSMFSSSGCPYSTPSPVDEVCKNQNSVWCRGPEQGCKACIDSDSIFRVKVTKKAKKATRTTCIQVSNKKKKVRRTTCKKRTEKGRRRVSELCPYTCDTCN